MATLFSSQGATPGFSAAPNSATSMVGGVGNTQSTTPQAKALDLTQGLSTANLAPKSQTQTNADGSSTTTTFHPPVDTSEFTPTQLANFTAAANLGSGVQTTSGMLGGSGSSPTPAPIQTNASDPITSIPAASTAAAGNTNTGTIGGLAPQAGSTASTGTTAGLVPSTSNETQYSSANPPTSQTGLLGAALGQEQGYYNTQQGLTTQSENLENQIQAQMGANTGQFNGTSADEAGRQAQLQNLENSGVAAIEAEQGKQANYETPLANQYSAGVNALSPTQQNVTPPAGGVSTNAATGQQYSNPIYEPTTGAYQALSPQPGGTANQPSTAGQASQYTIKSGDTLNAIAAANGITEAALAAANPNANPTDLQVGGSLTIPSSTGSATPFAGGQAAGAGEQGAQYQTNLGTIAAAQGIQTKLADDINTNGINSLSSVNFANALNQWVAGNTSNAAYQTFFQDLTDYTGKIAPLIGITGSATDMSRGIASALINYTGSGSTIEQGLNNLMALAVNNNNALKSAGTGGQTNQTATTVSGASGGSGTTQNTTTADGQTLGWTYANGKWSSSS